MKARGIRPIVLLTLALGACLLMSACSQDATVAPTTADSNPATVEDEFALAAVKGVSIDHQTGDMVPADMVTIDCFGRDLSFWPFTGAKLDGVPMDPIHLIFAGNADPMQIRAALLALDGDRSALGAPDAYPFNQVWTDALGGTVQSTYADDGGWLGSVIQLTLGDYEPIRFHLRLFRTRALGMDNERYTLGAAHFEVLIPGTTDHQVLSWQVAKELVIGDLMRSGLLDPAEHLRPTQAITPAPGFREIIPAVYNGLPDELIYLIGGPAKPVIDPVPIDNGDGTAMMVYLAGAAPVMPGSYYNTATIDFDQYVPRPYCSTGPGDWLYITGPVVFETAVTVDEFGVFNYNEGYAGDLFGVPVDISTGQPVGEAFSAKVWGMQHGWLDFTGGRVGSFDKKLTHEDGPQMQYLQLKIGEWDKAMYRGFERCLDDQ